MKYLPALPLTINQFALFGLLLVIGVIGGELANKARLPRLIGYLLMGVLSGPKCLNVLNSEILMQSRLFIDISLGLVLFELGRQLNLTWLRNNPWLFVMSLCESGLSFLFCLAILIWAGFTWLPASLAATIFMASSPAIVLIIILDLRAEGPVSRHTATLITLNNLLSLLLFNLLLPHLQDNDTLTVNLRWAEALYRIAGSTILGLFLFFCTIIIARLTQKHETNQFILLVGMVIVSISFSQTLNLSVLLTLLIFGIAARNIDFTRALVVHDFDLMGRLFFIPLFVVTGSFLEFSWNFDNLLIVLALFFARIFGKAIAIYFIGKKAKILKKQGVLITLALTPMAGLALSLTQRISDMNSTLGSHLATIMAALITVFHLIGPLATQFSLISADEAHDSNLLKRISWWKV